jgi:hypothetical protein
MQCERLSTPATRLLQLQPPPYHDHQLLLVLLHALADQHT